MLIREAAELGTSGPVQRKPTIGSPGDRHEREVDGMEDNAMIGGPTSGSTPHGRVHGSGAQRDESLAAVAGHPTDGPRAEGADGGSPLPETIRAAAVPQLGPLVDHIRVHRTRFAAEQADALGAAAFTLGHDVYIGSALASHADDDARVQRTLLHEAVHAAQQSTASGIATSQPRPRSDPSEREAHQVVSGMLLGSLRSEYERLSGAIGPGPTTTAQPRRPALTITQVGPQLLELTCDDGPDGAGNTRKTLDHLNKVGAKATFYLVGQRVEEGDNRKVVYDIAASGHWVGNHAFDWNTTTDNHIFLNGTVSERAAKILKTEFAIRNALTKGKADATKSGTWKSVPATAQTYIDDVISNGTGRFRTPGFRSKPWTTDGRTTRSAIRVVNEIVEAAGLRRLEVSDSVSIDPKDWESGRTQADVESAVKSGLSSDKDSILLHSRLAISADATPAILSEIGTKGFTYQAPAQGTKAGSAAGVGFGGVKTSVDWIDRFQKQVSPIGDTTSTMVTDPIDRTITRQVGLVWAQYDDGSEYLTQVEIVTSSVPKPTTITFKMFVDSDLKDLGSARAFSHQPKGIQTLPKSRIDGIPATPRATAAKK